MLLSAVIDAGLAASVPGVAVTVEHLLADMLDGGASIVSAACVAVASRLAQPQIANMWRHPSKNPCPVEGTLLWPPGTLLEVLLELLLGKSSWPSCWLNENPAGRAACSASRPARSPRSYPH